jgi:hypothetical protein
MKRIVLWILLVPLALVELYLCSAFLPMRWQLALSRILPQSHDHSLITHPALEQEIEQVLRNNFALQLALEASLLLLLAGNTLLVIRVWKLLRRSQNAIS